MSSASVGGAVVVVVLLSVLVLVLVDSSFSLSNVRVQTPGLLGSCVAIAPSSCNPKARFGTLRVMVVTLEKLGKSRCSTLALQPSAASAVLCWITSAAAVPCTTSRCACAVELASVAPTGRSLWPEGVTLNSCATYSLAVVLGTPICRSSRFSMRLPWRNSGGTTVRGAWIISGTSPLPAPSAAALASGLTLVTLGAGGAGAGSAGGGV